jgi:hypothetical protein
MNGLKLEARNHAARTVSQFLSVQEGFAGWLRRLDQWEEE